MSEEIQLSPALLPREKYYRTQRSALLSIVAKLVVVGLIAYGVTWFVSRAFARWTMSLPEPDLVAVVVILALACARVWRFRKLHGLLKENFDALALLESGNSGEAGRKLDAMCRAIPADSQYRALFVFNRGVAFLRAGDPDRALSLFAAVLDSGRFETPRHCLHVFYPMLLNALGTAYALKGDFSAAERWQGLAHDHVTPARAGLLLPLDTLLGIRAGRYAVVVKDAEAGWAAAEGALPVSQMKALRLLCAFALAHINDDGAHEAKIKQFLDGARPCREGEFDYLTRNWPEFRAFLSEHGFSAPAPAAPEPLGRAARMV